MLRSSNTQYFLQDREDDVKIGVKSTSLLFGDHVRKILAVFAAGFVSAIAVAGYLNHQGLWYYLISVGATAFHLLWQLLTLRENDTEDCWNKFEVSYLFL